MSRIAISTTCAVLLLSLVTAGCDSGGTGGTEDPILLNMQLDVNELPPLGGSNNYRAWAVLPTRFLGSDLFNLTETGQYVNSTGQFISNTFTFGDAIGETTKVLISVENKDGSEDAPSSTIVLAGDIVDFQADLTVTHPDALGEGFDSASGVFSLLTPSDADDTNETEGIWFVESISAGNWTTGLSLPARPEGWLFEGWVEVADTVLSTGRFDSATGADMDSPFMTDLVREFIDYPGEDFFMQPPPGVTFPPDFSNARVFVTLEPDPDGQPAPFAIEILSGTVSATPEPLTNYELQGGLVAPTGSALVR